MRSDPIRRLFDGIMLTTSENKIQNELFCDGKRSSFKNRIFRKSCPPDDVLHRINTYESFMDLLYADILLFPHCSPYNVQVSLRILILSAVSSCVFCPFRLIKFVSDFSCVFVFPKTAVSFIFFFFLFGSPCMYLLRPYEIGVSIRRFRHRTNAFVMSVMRLIINITYSDRTSLFERH